MFFLLIFIQNEMGLTDFSSSLSPLFFFTPRACHFPSIFIQHHNLEGAVEPGRRYRAAPTTDDPEHMSSTALLYSQGSPTQSSQPSFQPSSPHKRSFTVFLTALRSPAHRRSPLRTLYLSTPLCSQHHLWAENGGW